MFETANSVTLDLQRMSEIDITGSNVLKALAEKTRKSGKHLLFCNVPEAQLSVLKPVFDVGAKPSVFPDVNSAMEWLETAHSKGQGQVWCSIAALIILCSSTPTLSNNIIQKGLAFVRHWSGSVLSFRALRRSGILPRRLSGRGGASVVRRDAAMNRTEIPMSKVRQEARKDSHLQVQACANHSGKACARLLMYAPDAGKKAAAKSKQSVSLRCCNHRRARRLLR